MNQTKKYIGAMAVGCLLMATPSCTDSWDDHYQGAEFGNAATETLWQKIESNPNLSRFASIAKVASYYKDQQHPMKDNATGKDFTFSQLLNSDQIITLWAPDNDAFTEDSYSQWMELAKTNGYNVQQQLMANSIALWRNNISNGTIDTLRMLNGKIMIFDQKEKTIAGLPVDNSDVPASNGSLYTVKEVLPFDFNIYEYLKDKLNAQEKGINMFNQYVLINDTTYFDENSSLEGTPDPDGNPTYVDSTYQNSNNLFDATHRRTLSNKEKNLTAIESFGANIASEDSSFVMLIPKDVAWQEAYNRLAPLYKYANVYLDNEKADRSIKASREITAEQMDSLTNLSINMDIISPLCFNVNIQPKAEGNVDLWKAEDFVTAQAAGAKYVLNTFGDTLRSDANWDKSGLFEGQKVKLSNGYAILADRWNIPQKLYKPNVIVEVNSYSFYNREGWKNQASDSPQSFSFSNKTTWNKETGNVSHNNFYYVFPTSDASKPSIEFKLVGTDGENEESEVMSGRYDIKVVMVPNHYMTSTDSTIVLTVGERGTGKVVNGDTIPVKHKLKATLTYVDNSADNNNFPKLATLTTAKAEYVNYDGTKVDTLTIFKDFVFPYSYKNLLHSYPTLTLQADVSSSEKKEGYTHDFCIDQIILVSKDDNTVISVRKE